MQYVLALILIIAVIFVIIKFAWFFVMLTVLGITLAAVIKYFKAKRAVAAEYSKYSSVAAAEISKLKGDLNELLLCLYLGWAGGHKFYRHKKGLGFTYLFTAGLAFVGWWGDTIRLCMAYFSKKNAAEFSMLRKITPYIVAFICAAILVSCGANSQPDRNSDNTSTEVTTDATTEDTSEVVSADISTESTPEATEDTTAIEETTAATTEATTEPTTEPPTETTETEPIGTTYILNTNSKKFHYPNCSSAQSIKESNKSTYVGTREELIEMGYAPCGRCDP